MSFVKTIVVILLPLLVGGAIVFGIVKTKPELLGIPKQGAPILTEADELVTLVSKLMTLPTDEKPTVATILDIKKVAGQDFYKNAKEGDKVLIFTTNKKAVIYRPSENKIIDVGVVSINEVIKPSISPLPESTTSATSSGTPKSTLKPVQTEISSPTPKSTPVLVY